MPPRGNSLVTTTRESSVDGAKKQLLCNDGIGFKTPQSTFRLNKVFKKRLGAESGAMLIKNLILEIHG